MSEYPSESDFESGSRKRERVKFDHMIKKNWIKNSKLGRYYTLIFANIL